jgi:Zn-dependent membrane protease YugP
MEMWLLLTIGPLILVFYAQHKVKSTYQKFAEEANLLGVPGGVLARRLLDLHGLRDVGIEVSEGQLSDHYDPTTRTLRLSPDIYSNPSVSALGIVAHEVGHAVQHARAFGPMQLRTALVPAVNFGSSLAPWLFLAGLFMQVTGLIWAAVVFFSAAVLFHLVTLPVELDASNRARAMLTVNGLVTPQESGAVNAVLNAAALTYIAALVSAMGQLMYFVLVAVGMGNRDD